MDEQSSAALSGAASGASMGAAAGPYGALIGGIAGGAIGYFGSSDTKRPTYEIPDEIKQNLSSAQLRVLQGIPAAQQQLFIQNLQRGTSFNLREAGTRKAGIAGLAALNENQNQAYLGLTAANQAAQQQNEAALTAARSQMAEYKDQKFQVNDLNKYYEDEAKAQAQQGALLQNVSTATQMYGAYGNKKSGQQGTAPVDYNQYNAPGQYKTAQYNPTVMEGAPQQSYADKNWQTEQQPFTMKGGYNPFNPGSYNPYITK